MSNDVETRLHKLVETISQHTLVRAIGLSGRERPFPEGGDGDLDLFVYCTEVPSAGQRQELLMPLQSELEAIEIGKLQGGHWGEGDCLHLAGIETWLLYFTLEDARLELEAVLSGKYPGRLDSYYYPIGRLAMWKMMRVLCDKDDFLDAIKRRIEIYPEKLAHVILNHHLRALADVEDLERAVQRGDIFFYHFALDLALDHFLQALFALNHEYFPSRKRSEDYLRSFKHKPADCEHRLKQVIQLGGQSETLRQSYSGWQVMVQDLTQLCEPST